MMNFNKSLTLLMSCLLISLPAFTQNFHSGIGSGNTRSCDTDVLHQQKMQNDLTYRKHYREKQEQLRQSLINRSVVLCDNPVIIPVAVHFQNVTNPDIDCLRALADNQIQILNDDFQGLNADIIEWTGTAAASFPGVSNGETCVEFCLATNYHPSGYGVLDGETAVTVNQGTSSNYGDWSGYLNIFVRNIGALGFSPLGGDGDGDGVTVDNAAFGSGAGCVGFVPGSPYDLGRTLTHEVGHYFNLGHIWGGGCGSDDQVADTPDSDSSYGGCPSIGVASCGSTDMHMNYMDYTNDACMYMLSAGQSARMETYVDNFLDIIVNNDTVCTGPQPRIQFVSTSTSVSEGTSSCNSAGTQTISIDLNIATGPSANAVVSFQTAGTANASDFSINPSSVTFPAGIASTQTVTISINEDAYIEDTETIDITYTIIPNGGDAIAGPSNQMHSITIVNDDYLPTDAVISLVDEDFNAGSAGWIINDGGSTTDTWELSNGLNGNSINGSQFMIVNSDAAGNGSTSDEELLSPIFNTNGMTEITLTFDQYINTYNQGGFETFEVDVWDGSVWQNVFFHDEDDGDLGSWASPNMASFDLSAYANANMQVRFTYTAGYDWWWAIDNVKVMANSNTEIQLNSNTSGGFAEHELGAFETVHFFDTNTGNIMLSIENTSGHDYGCTYVEIDQSAGDNPGAVPSNAPEAEFLTNRSFRVVPSNNNSAGTYNISLYYTEAEITGWVAASGSAAMDLEMVKSSTSIASATFLELITPTVTDFNGDYIYTASVSTGFSGFALGNPAASLPVELSNLYAQAKEKTILVNWQTKSELNNRGFELLRSTNPQSGFSPIAWIDGKGSTDRRADYVFEDTKVIAGVDYYYQLRQVDFDGTDALSSIVSARLSDKQGGFLVYPNPVQSSINIYFADQSSSGTLRIFDMVGKTVLNKVIEDQQHVNLPVEHLSKGVYWIEFRDAQGQSNIQKLLKVD